MKFILGNMEYILSVGKRYAQPNKKRLYTNPKKYWNVFFLDENGGFHRKRIKWWQVFGYKRKKVKRINN